MKRPLQWIPMAVVLIAAAVGAYIYRYELIAWFKPQGGEAKSGAAGGPADHASHAAAQNPVKMSDRPVNDVCPIRGGEVAADVATMTWRGHTIGFCCPGCDTQWEQLPESEKDAFVNKFLVDGAQAAKDRRPKPDAPEPMPGDIAHYTCSMHPSVRSRDPGTCPICKMDLIGVTHEELRSGVIFVDAQRRQLIGLRTQTVETRELVRSIRAMGVVAYDQTRLVDVNLKYGGWIGELQADYVGKHVEAGEPIFTIYSPEVLTAQQEYLDAVRAGRAGESSRTKLELWDLTAGQLTALKGLASPERYISVFAPATGTVIEKHVVRGSAIEPGSMLFRIADLTTVWIEAELYETELPLVEAGQKAAIELSYLPGRTFSGNVSYIYPYLDAKTRRGRIRIEAPNPDGQLKPEMYAEVDIRIDLGPRLAIPNDAVLYAGDSRVVFLDIGDSKLRPQHIKTGQRAGEWVEVLSGLSEGDKLVTSGNFLIASESKLKSGIDKW